MKLASLPSRNHKNRNGDLIVVSKDNQRAVRAGEDLALNLLEALQNWKEVSPKLLEISHALNTGKIA